MPLYKFHFTDGQSVVPDDRGLNLPDDKAAIAEARQIACDLQQAPPEENWSDWIVEVTDESGRRVIAVRAAEVERGGSG